MIFELPIKEIIVNRDTQMRLLEDDGTPYAALDATPSAGGVIFEGYFANTVILGSQFELLKAATRIIKDTPVAATAEVSTYVLTGTAAAADTVFRLVVDSLDLTPSEFQNRGYEKRYQIPVQSTVDGVGAALAAAINADKNSPVVAVYTAASDTLQLTVKETGKTAILYSDGYTLPARTVTTPATAGVNTYDQLKNINWNRDVELDRNLHYFPAIGGTYNSYYFRIKKPSPDGGDVHFPTSTLHDMSSDFKIYVAPGLTLDTALTALAGDLNV